MKRVVLALSLACLSLGTRRDAVGGKGAAGRRAAGPAAAEVVAAVAVIVAVEVAEIPAVVGAAGTALAAEVAAVTAAAAKSTGAIGAPATRIARRATTAATGLDRLRQAVMASAPTPTRALIRTASRLYAMALSRCRINLTVRRWCAAPPSEYSPKMTHGTRSYVARPRSSSPQGQQYAQRGSAQGQREYEGAVQHLGTTDRLVKPATLPSRSSSNTANVARRSSQPTLADPQDDDYGSSRVQRTSQRTYVR